MKCRDLRNAYSTSRSDQPYHVTGGVETEDPEIAQVLSLGSFREAILICGLMSDKEWACLEPFVIGRGAQSGRPPRNHRLVLDGIFWIAQMGGAWRDLDQHFGKWSSVYYQFRRWTKSGLWATLLQSLDKGGDDFTLQMMDGSIIRTHACSAGARERLRVRVLAVQKMALRQTFVSTSMR